MAAVLTLLKASHAVNVFARNVVELVGKPIKTSHAKNSRLSIERKTKIQQVTNHADNLIIVF